MAEQADIHDLYERAVQNVEHEVEFTQATFERLRGRKATGFAKISAAPRTRRANGCVRVSDSRRLAWTSIRTCSTGDAAIASVSCQSADRTRVQLLESDVMAVATPPVDIVIALNFSYFIFDTRDTLRDYFARVRAGLVETACSSSICSVARRRRKR